MNASRGGRLTTVVLALLIGGMIFSGVREYWKAGWIIQDTKQTVATITAKLSHGVLEYRYSVDGVQYVGQGQSGRNLHREAGIGGQGMVFFSSSHPWLSSPNFPTFSLWNALLILALLLAVESYLVRDILKPSRPPRNCAGI